MRLKNAVANGLVLYSLACHSKSKIDALIALSWYLCHTEMHMQRDKVENIGIEPMTSCMPCKRSSQLS